MSNNPPKPAARRFAPTPVETLSWSSSSKTRRFPIQPVETSTRSNRKPTEKEKAEANDVEEKDFARSPAPKRFLPIPVETSFHSNRQTKVLDTSTSPESTSKKPRRKFTPQLIEKSKRSRKAGDTRPATLPTDKTDLTPGVPNIYTNPKNPTSRPSTPGATSSAASGDIPITPRRSSYLNHLLPYLPRRHGSMRPHCNTRQASFTSSLEPISSSESNSEKSSPSHSPTRTPSLSGSILSLEDPPHHIARTRESCDERFSGYLLALAAKAAEKQLREQALLAAFPNETKHEIVEHFYDREIEGASDNDSIEYVGIVDIHGESQTKLNHNRKVLMKRKSSESGWAIQEMQMHQDKCARLRDQSNPEKKAEDAAKLPFSDLHWMDGAQYLPPGKRASSERQLQKMRNAASPPMLGADITFRNFPSPKATRFESDQQINMKPNRCEKGGGLWGGYCVAEEPGELLVQSVKGPSFIHTPMVGENFGDPFAKAFHEVSETQVKSPASLRRLKSDKMDSMELEDLSKEFDDHFVTQVYNYLSLGYPSLARQFDDELSRISKVPIENLRSDDQMNAKGHIGLKKVSFSETDNTLTHYNNASEDPGTDEPNQRGARWHALKIYILEWGRQHPSLSQAAIGPSAWGVRARRGSWGI
ncbi:hypothetical protein K3495_g7700 [Podosphaera aphanis]|nr:hypothetical protein K3495_g7700 [Podosphaera aphanis]